MNEFDFQERNNRQVRPLIWLFAAGFILMAVVVGLGFSFINTADSAEPPPTVNTVEPKGPQGRPANDVINPTLDPAQVLVSNRPRFEIQAGDVNWRLNPRATFIIAGRIVGNQQYFDSESDLTPLDLLIAWGDLSNPEADKWITWDQYLRAGHYNWSGQIPYTKEYINNHASNVHIIPATENLTWAINELELNDNVLMAGLLVDIRSDNISIDTSLTRTDTGAGACEIYYVERLVIDGVEYR